MRAVNLQQELSAKRCDSCRKNTLTIRKGALEINRVIVSGHIVDGPWKVTTSSGTWHWRYLVRSLSEPLCEGASPRTEDFLIRLPAPVFQEAKDNKLIWHGSPIKIKGRLHTVPFQMRTMFAILEDEMAHYKQSTGEFPVDSDGRLDWHKLYGNGYHNDDAAIFMEPTFYVTPRGKPAVKWSSLNHEIFVEEIQQDVSRKGSYDISHVEVSGKVFRTPRNAVSGDFLRFGLISNDGFLIPCARFADNEELFEEGDRLKIHGRLMSYPLESLAIQVWIDGFQSIKGPRNKEKSGTRPC